MKLSSSTLCGCCFCCYCHCWLMMLLMVSSVVQVSPEMSTTTNPTNPTTTITNKKYIKFYNNNINNNNNYAYQSDMTEFVQLNNRKLEIPNRTNRKTVATTNTTPFSTLFSLPATLEVTTISDDDYLYKENNIKSYPVTTTTKNAIKTFQNDTITTNATIQTTTTATQQQSLLSSRLKATTLQVATSPNTIISTFTTTTAPVQIQMLQQQQQTNLYDPTATTESASTTILAKESSKRSKRQFVEDGEEKEVQEDVIYMYDNSIEEEEVEEMKSVKEVTATTTTTNNYVDDNINAFVPPTILMLEPTTEFFVKTETITKSLQQPKDYSSSNKFKKMATKYWNTDNNTKQKQQYNNASSSSTNKNSSDNSNIDNSSSNSESYKDFSNSNSKKQKNINTFSLNHHNQQHYDAVAEIQNKQIPKQLQKPQLQQNHLKTALKITIENSTTTAFIEKKRTINFSPANGTATTTTQNSTQIPNNTNDNNNIYITSGDAVAVISDDNSVSNLSPPKETIHVSNVQGNHFQIPTSSVATTTLRTPVTYTPLHQYHAGFNQLRRPALLHHKHRHTRQAAVDDEQNDKCRMFVEGDPEKNELYSPDYPNDYPKNINCTRVITAPKGQIIRLDFRNSFHIEEKEECKFDFLEIRDGQYGFSNLIGKYCGTDFPPEITSKERYLWLHFHSDESIEYSGFTAVYEFIDRNRDAPSTDLNCTIERGGFEGFVNISDVPPEINDTVIHNKIPLDCMWRIQVQEKWKIQVKFVEFKLAKPNDCETNFLDIFPEQTVMPLRVKNFCGSAGEGITSESNVLHVRFYAEPSAISSTFSILYTAFRERGSSSCAEDEYDCEDATCIAGNLKCNGRSNCKFLWDEEGCKLEDNGQSEHMIIIITVFGLILGGMVITFLVNCVRKIMHDQKIIREHIRQSKESKLDEMGRNSKGRSRDNISIVSPRQKHSQTSLQILDDVSNRYYRELEMQTKGNFKEKDPSILRHDMIVQTSLCSTDDSSTTITEQTPPVAAAAVGSNACDMGCQTRESLFATASLMRQKSKTPSIAGSQHTIEGVPPPPRFSTFGYDAAHIAPPPPPTVSTLSRRNMHLPQESLEMEQLPPPQPQQTAHTMMMMPQQQKQQQQQQQHHTPQQQHQHLHHRPSQEICHHHHQHQQHLQKQTLPRHHQQQQQQHPQHHQHIQQPQHHQHHTSSTTIPPNVAQIPAPGTAIVTAISTGSSGRQKEQQQQQQSAITGVKGKQTKVDESKVFIDIRNSAPDVIIMTSH